MRQSKVLEKILWTVTKGVLFQFPPGGNCSLVRLSICRLVDINFILKKQKKNLIFIQTRFSTICYNTVSTFSSLIIETFQINKEFYGGTSSLCNGQQSKLLGHSLVMSSILFVFVASCPNWRTLNNNKEIKRPHHWRRSLSFFWWTQNRRNAWNVWGGEIWEILLFGQRKRTR